LEIEVRGKRFVITGFFLALASLGTVFGQAAGPTQVSPSFSCARATGAVEAAICETPALAAADRDMALLYAANRLSAFGTGPSNELPEQRRSLQAMQDCAAKRTNQTLVDCLRSLYDNRNAELATAAVIRAPSLALPVLRRTDPGFAQILEALQIWSSEPQDSDWSVPTRAAKRSRVLALLKLTITGVLTDKDNYLAQEFLVDPAPGAISVKRVEDVLMSDRHFALFLNILGSVSIDDSNTNARRVLPCMAIVRHPGLLSATGPIFGSTMDNTVLNSDCDQTLPPTPVLSAFDAKLKKTWPQCDGTIRFAAYRTYQVALDAARLGVAEHDPAASSPSLDGIRPSDIAAVRNELTGYYSRYLGKSHASANAMSRDAINALLKDAHECD
jgi:uncharacterized protein